MPNLVPEKQLWDIPERRESLTWRSAQETIEIVLHKTIRNDDFKRNRALQCWNNVAAI